MALQISRGDRYPVPQSPSNVTPRFSGISREYDVLDKGTHVAGPFALLGFPGEGES